MEFNWLVVDNKKGIITKDSETGDFITFDQCDLSFMPEDILQIQYDKNDGNSFIQRIIDGQVVETGITDISEVPNLSQLITIFEQRLEEYKEQPPSNDDLMFWLRAIRNQLLSEADIVILRMLESGETVPSSWIEYRQALRDLPSEVEAGNLPMPTYTTEGSQWFPEYVITYDNWPVKP